MYRVGVGVDDVDGAWVLRRMRGCARLLDAVDKITRRPIRVRVRHMFDALHMLFERFRLVSRLDRGREEEEEAEDETIEDGRWKGKMEGDAKVGKCVGKRTSGSRRLWVV